MATGISYDVKTKQTVIREIEFVEHVKTPEELEQDYRQRVVELIGERYSPADETGLTNDAILQIMAGDAITQSYTDYRIFVEECKDKAYMEVYDEERT